MTLEIIDKQISQQIYYDKNVHKRKKMNVNDIPGQVTFLKGSFRKLIIIKKCNIKHQPTL